MWSQMQKFIEKAKSGQKVKGVFTDPNTAIKCGGAPKKVMYLTNARLNEANARVNAELSFYTDSGKLFGVKEYADAIEKQFIARDMKWNFNHNLAAVDIAKKVAIFDKHWQEKGAYDKDLEEYETITKHENIEVPFDLLHITPPQKAPDEIGKSAIGSAKGWVPVDKETLQHVKYKNIFSEYANRIEALRKDLKRLKYLKIIQTDNTDRYDRSKFVISVKHAPMSSHELYEILLHRYHLQMEMLAGTYVLAMTTVGDTQEGLDRLRDALLEIDKEIDTKQGRPAAIETDLPLSGRQPALEKVWTIAEAVNRRDKIQKRSFEDSIGCISVEYAYLYPPGSPLIVPGERITKEAVEILHWYQEHDFSIEGLQSEDGIEVWIDG